jgi:hypothetical protein
MSLIPTVYVPRAKRLKSSNRPTLYFLSFRKKQLGFCMRLTITNRNTDDEMTNGIILSCDISVRKIFSFPSPERVFGKLGEE